MPLNTMSTDEENRWNALVRRDRTAEGTFYYAVKTTGVFCRPGCSSRLPKRENVEFFDTYKEGEQAGYRPCKRCKPGAASPRERLVALIVKACRQLEKAEISPTLEQLAAETGLSPWHFHRIFKEIVGITPKQYASTQQAQRFQDSLKTEQTVTAAIYSAGFSSSSRAYDITRDRLAMTPSAYKKGAAGLTIHYGTASCCLGWILVAGTERGICAIVFGDDPKVLPNQIQESFPNAYLKNASLDFSAIIEQVITLIEAPKNGIKLPLDIQSAAFQERVWSALSLVPPNKYCERW